MPDQRKNVPSSTYLCPKCRATGVNPDACDHCGIFFASFRKHQHKVKILESGGFLGSEKDAESTNGNRVIFDHWKIHVFALPAVVLFTLVIKLVPALDFIPTYFFTIPLHEFGHAITAWISGRFAFPIGALIPMAAFTQISSEKNFLVTLLWLSGLGYLAFLSLKAKKPYLFLVSACFILASLKMTWFSGIETSSMLITYFGCGGEFVLATLLMIAFYYRLPDSWRWDFFRYPFLLVGGYGFASAYLQWHQISRGTRPLPIGSFLDGVGGPGGDMGALMSQYHWSQAEIIASYTKIGNLCAWIIAAHYFYFLARSLIQPTSPQP
jgi:hypothetical protein